MSDDLFELVREHVTIFEMLQEFAPASFAAVRSREVGHKIPCPFAESRHPRGADPNPSAKFFPDTQSVYCWSCHGTWDVISFYAEANGMFRTDDQGRPVTDPKGRPALEYGRAAAELARQRGLEYKRHDWLSKLRQNISSLSEVNNGVIPAAQWARLQGYYISRLCAAARGAGPEDFPAIAPCLDHVLDLVPPGGTPGAERELHVWLGDASALVSARLSARRALAGYHPDMLPA